MRGAQAPCKKEADPWQGRLRQGAVIGQRLQGENQKVRVPLN